MIFEPFQRLREMKQETIMKVKLRMKCKVCGHWNRFEVEKIFFNPDSQEPKVQVFLPPYLPLKTEVCSKCKNVIAEPKKQ